MLGDGTVSVAQTGDGVTTGMYTITDVFSAPPNFLATGDFTIEMTSYACANGVMQGGGNFPPVPEPRTGLLVVTALALFGGRYVRHRRLRSEPRA